MRLLKFSLITVCCLLFAVPLARANESALAVSPAITEVITKPSESVVKDIQITNTTNFPLPIHAQAAKFLSSEINVEDGDATFDASSWFTIDPPDFILQPHESRTVHLTINAPLDAEPGGHYATVFFNPLIPQSVLTPDSATALARIGVLAFLVVPGNIHEQLALKQVQVPKFLSQSPLKASVELTNTGSIHLIPLVTLKLVNIWGHTVEEVRGDLITVLPGTTRTLELVTTKPHLFGRYEAVVGVQYGTASPPIVSPPQTIWLIPWPPLLGFALLLTFAYRLFIVNGKRVKLAWQVLQGKSITNDYENPQTQSKIKKKSSQSGEPRPRARRRPHSTLPRT